MTKTILIIEDDVNFLAALQAKLSVEGYLVKVSKNGSEGLQKVEEKVDLIVLDVLLPDIDGFQILEKIKSDPDIEETPVVIITNLSDKASRDKGLELGAKDFMVKPEYKVDEIVEKIKGLLQ